MEASSSSSSSTTNQRKGRLMTDITIAANNEAANNDGAPRKHGDDWRDADARFAAEYEERQQQWEAGIEERTRVFFAKLNEPAEDPAAEQERLFERSRRLMTANSQS